jgi:two-component system chemotaxis response regulator CheB
MEKSPVAVVALTGSAGALSSVVDVLERLPDPFAASVIVLLHQAPGYETQLDEILARSSGMPVRFAGTDERLTPGQVLAVPSGYHMVVAPGDRAKLVMSGRYPPNRPLADILLSTMGVALGERPIAVVLSGGGRDGATGATVVHGCGGTVIAADPGSTPHPSMPNEVIERDAAVDHIPDPPAIAELLIELTAV